MQIQKTIKSHVGGFWYRCRRVVVENEVVHWQLSRTGRYQPVADYPLGPHRQLAAAVDDQTLKAFVKAWGPLRRFPLTVWEGSDSLSSYRRVRDIFRAWVLFLAAIEKPEHLRSSIRDLLRLFDNDEFIWLRGRLGVPGDPAEGFDEAFDMRLAVATRAEIQDICDYLVSQFFPILAASSLTIERIGKSSKIRASSGVDSLVTALYWMVWQDYFRESPWQVCEECRFVFQPQYKHKMKFHNSKCAHRKVARESARRKANKAKENAINGTQKAR